MIKDPKLVTKETETIELIHHEIFSPMDLASSPKDEYSFMEMVGGVIQFKTGETVKDKTSYKRAFK